MSKSELSQAEFDKVRMAARKAANQLQNHFESEGEPFGWFEALYDRAKGEPAAIPWANAAPRFKIKEWLADNPGLGRSALDVGCGLGDNARCLAEAGWKVTAFDISKTAVTWARQRSGDDTVIYEAADLFHPPQKWLGSFDLVHETYNLQAMPRDRVSDALEAMANFVAPGGRILVIARARERQEVPEGPPWPISKEEIQVLSEFRLTETRMEEFYDMKENPIRHFLAEYTRM